MQGGSGWRWTWILLGAAVLLLVIASISLSRDRGRFSAPEQWLQIGLQPVEGAVSWAAGQVQEGLENIRRLRNQAKENQELRERLERLNALIVENEELRQENARLRGLFGLRDELSPYLWESARAARVVGRNPDNWFRFVDLDRAARDGVTEDMVGMTAQGLIGRVVRVGPSTARLMLLSDPDSAIGVTVQRADSRDIGILEGVPGQEQVAVMRFFAPDADVAEGDRIVTSGLGGRFPSGLPVGVVETVGSDSFGLVKEARVRLLADLSRLEEVLLVGGAR